MRPYDRKRRKGCHAIARQRARHARKQGQPKIAVLLIYLWALLSGPLRMPPFAFLPNRSSASLPRQPAGAVSDDWPVTEYERGAGGCVMRPRSAVTSGTDRYRSRPSLARLMADLHRPAARKDAAAALEARIVDPVIRAWVAERIAKDEINRLSIWVQSERAEETVMAAWRSEADAALAEATIVCPSPEKSNLLQVAKLLEALAGAEGATSGGPKR